MTAQSRELSVTEENNSYKNPQRETQSMPSHVKTKQSQTYSVSIALDRISLWLEEEKNHSFFTSLRRTWIAVLTTPEICCISLHTFTISKIKWRREISPNSFNLSIINVFFIAQIKFEKPTGLAWSATVMIRCGKI